jgi:vesicle transport through interaction with t-SNAREs protein 1
MEIEFGTLPAAIKSQIQPRLKNYKDELKKFKADQKKVASEYSDREALLGSASTAGHIAVDVDSAQMNQRGRLLQGTEKLQDASRRLEEAKRVALETGNAIENHEQLMSD